MYILLPYHQSVFFAILVNMKSLSLNQPHLIILTGVKGSGKTFFAEQFAKTFHAPYVSHDRIARFVTDTKATNKLAEYQLEELLKTKQPIVIDGFATTRTERADLSQKAREADYAVLLIWVQTDPATAKSRAIKTSNGQFDPEVYERAVKRFTPPNAAEKPVVISGKHTYASQAKVVLKRLTAPRAAAISTHQTAPVRPETTHRRNITIR